MSAKVKGPADVASGDLLDFIEATGRACSLSTTSVKFVLSHNMSKNIRTIPTY